MCDRVKVEAKDSNELYSILNDWKINIADKKLIFVYDPLDNGWRYRIVLFLDNAISHVIHGELESDNKNPNNPLALLKTIIKQSDIESYYREYNSNTWPLTGNEASTDSLPLDNIKDDNISKVISDFAKRRSNILKKHEKDRPKLSAKAKDYIFARSMGCCEFDRCAEPLFQGKEGEYGYYGYFAHIIGASANGPRSESLVSNDEIADPQNFLFLCDKHHRLIDKVDLESYDKNKLRQMLEKRRSQRELLVSQLTYEEANGVAIISDIAGVSSGINSDEALKAMLSYGLKPIGNNSINRKYLGDQINGHELLKNSANTYWANFLNQYKQQINGLKNLVDNDSEQAARYQRLAIFPLGNMPTMFLSGYIIGDARPITLFHRDRVRDGGTWHWDESPTKTNFSWRRTNTTVDECDTDIILLSLEITAHLREELIPDDIYNLPRISITADNPSQNPFGSIADFNKLRDTLQEAINFAQDTLRAKEIHIICIAPATTVFALGQKFQRRNASKLHIYQTAVDQPYYPVFSFCQGIVSMTDNPDLKIEL